MSELREKLREALAKVVPGPWFRAVDDGPDEEEYCEYIAGHIPGGGTISVAYEMRKPEFNYFLLLSPENIRTLLDELDAKDRGLEEARIDAAHATQSIAELHGLIEQAVRALGPFDKALDDLAKGWGSADECPVYDYTLIIGDFGLARSTLSLLKASRPQNREETE